MNAKAPSSLIRAKRLCAYTKNLKYAVKIEAAKKLSDSETCNLICFDAPTTDAKTSSFAETLSKKVP